MALVSPPSDAPDVLDLLFDDHEGLLKEEVPHEQSIDFSVLGLDFDGNDLLESVLKEANIDDLDSCLNDLDTPCVQEDKRPQIPTDHDYYTHQKSPAHSDSGVSFDSGSYSPVSMTTEEHSPQYSPVEGCLSESPRSQSNLSLENSMEHTTDCSNLTGVGDVGTLNVDSMDGISAEELKMLDMVDFMGTGTQTDDVSINFGEHTDNSGTSLQSLLTPPNSTKTIKIIKVSHPQGSLPYTMKDVTTAHSSSTENFPELRLTEEEKDLLAREGMSLPTDMPLTKDEERALKAVRRKIRNKVSAKESRKRKQDYVDGLEKRVKHSTQENASLKKKVGDLEKQNSQLMQQLKKLQTFILSKTKPQTSTCMMVLVLSFAFFIVPNFKPFSPKEEGVMKSIPVRGNARNLLSESANEDDPNDPYGLSVKPGPPWEIPPKSPAIQIPQNIHVDFQDMDTQNKVEKSDLQMFSSKNAEQSQSTIFELNDTEFVHESNEMKIVDAV